MAIKKLFVFFFLLIVAGGGISLFVYSQRQAILLGKIQTGLESLLGVPLKIEGFKLKNRKDLSPIAKIEIAKIQIRNPSGFNQGIMAEISNVKFEINFLKLLTGRWRISHLEIPIDRVNLEINAQAKPNLLLLKALQKEALTATPNYYFGIQKMEYRFGTVYFYDYRNAQKPVIEHFDFDGTKQIYTAVRRPEALVQAPVLQLLYQINKGSLGLPRDKIQDALTGSTGKK